MRDKHKFSKTDGGPIDGAVAKQWIANYQDKHPDKIHAYYFGEDIIQTIIDQDKSVGMRVYLGYGDEGKLQMVLVGTRADGSDIWPDGGKDGGGSGTAGDNGLSTPPY